MKFFRWSRESKPMKEVWDHMTAGEKFKAHVYSAPYGLWYGLTVALPFGFLVRSVWLSLRPLPDLPEGMTMPFIFRMPWPIALGILLVGVAINIPVVIYLQRKLKQLCAATEWARSQGYTAEEL